MIFNKNSLNKRLNSLSSKRAKYITSGEVCSVYLLLALLILSVILMTGYAIKSVNNMIESAPRAGSLSLVYVSSAIYDDHNGKTTDASNEDSASQKHIFSEDIPKNLKNAFIAIEDERFYRHNGIDAKAILRESCYALTHIGHASQNADTITQQLVKNIYFKGRTATSPTAQIRQKVQEQWLALEIEKRNSKNEILTAYLNSIDLGKKTIGVEAASRYYFHKSAKDLSLSECAVLAAINKNPSDLNPADNPDGNKERQQLVLKKMYELALISEEEYQNALEDKVYERIKKNVG